MIYGNVQTMEMFSQENLQYIVLLIVPFLLAITVHELSHGLSAYMLGDDTAKRAGRLTLNPFAHIDIFGLLFLVLTRMFGWAKPVPVNYRILERHKYGPAIVALAGPASNMALAIVSAVVLKLTLMIDLHPGTLTTKIMYPINSMLVLSVMINVSLCVFNLLPILPLDGGRIVHNLLPYNKREAFGKSENIGFIILFILMYLGIIGKIIVPIIRQILSIFEMFLHISIF